MQAFFLFSSFTQPNFATNKDTPCIRKNAFPKCLYSNLVGRLYWHPVHDSTRIGPWLAERWPKKTSQGANWTVHNRQSTVTSGSAANRYLACVVMSAKQACFRTGKRLFGRSPPATNNKFSSKKTHANISLVDVVFIEADQNGKQVDMS